MGTDKEYDFSEAIDTFFHESREMLEDMESALLVLERENLDDDSINAIFRTAHTIKGSAGMFGFDDISTFTHIVESLLDLVRKNEIEIDSDMVALLFDCHDHIFKIITYFEKNREASINLESRVEEDKLISRLNKYLNLDLTKEEIKTDEEVDETTYEMNVKNKCWHISLRFGKDIFKNGLDPQSFISYLAKKGEIVNLKTIHHSIVPFEDMEPESCYLGFEIDFYGNTSKEQLYDVFEFVKDDCSIKLLPPKSDISQYVDLINELPEEPMGIGRILAEIGSLTESELDEALRLQKEHHDLIGKIMVNEKMVQEQVVEAAVEKQSRARKIDEQARKFIRVNTDKLDSLIDIVGELLISVANIEQRAILSDDVEFKESASSLTQLINDVRDSSMNLRMVQIGDSFKRFERAVRDLSRDSGKLIDLKLSGGETELDKTLIEKLMDPLLHIIRNSVDHGIDLPKNRLLQGKPERGRIELNAFHARGSVVIEVKDDGNGLDREKIISKAIKMDLLEADRAESLSDDEIYQFVFYPGFTTSEKVTELSGRGVGMDVVKRNIESLRGSAEVHSRKGQGTLIRIQLPLTLVIIDGFLVEVGNFNYVLPLDIVSECVNITKEKLQNTENGRFYDLRGEMIPYVRLRDLFSINGSTPKRESLIIVENRRKKIGLVIDRSIGEYQTVIKPLDAILSKIQWIGGATILGTGEVAMILDIPRFVQYIQALEAKREG
ncbi:chemotaxis protein CheA [Spirochaetota bacterium]